MAIKAERRNKMSYFGKKRFAMRQVVGLLTVVFLGISVIAYAVNITYTFSSGSPIRASEMNQNFADVKNAVDALEAKAATLEGKVTTLESKVAALEAKDADLITSSDNLSGQAWGGEIYGGRGATAMIYIIFVDSTSMNVTITSYDEETGVSLGWKQYSNCGYRIGTGIILLGCNFGVLVNVRFENTIPPKSSVTGWAFIGNSTLNVDHPKLTHGVFRLSKS